MEFDHTQNSDHTRNQRTKGTRGLLHSQSRNLEDKGDNVTASVGVALISGRDTTVRNDAKLRLGFASGYRATHDPHLDVTYIREHGTRSTFCP